jgi:hypothetical protein
MNHARRRDIAQCKDHLHGNLAQLVHRQPAARLALHVRQQSGAQQLQYDHQMRVEVECPRTLHAHDGAPSVLVTLVQREKFVELLHADESILAVHHFQRDETVARDHRNAVNARRCRGTVRCNCRRSRRCRCIRRMVRRVLYGAASVAVAQMVLRRRRRSKGVFGDDQLTERAFAHKLQHTIPPAHPQNEKNGGMQREPRSHCTQPLAVACSIASQVTCFVVLVEQRERAGDTQESVRARPIGRSRGKGRCSDTTRRSGGSGCSGRTSRTAFRCEGCCTARVRRTGTCLPLHVLLRCLFVDALHERAQSAGELTNEVRTCGEAVHTAIRSNRRR